MKLFSERPLLTFFVLTWLLSWPFWIASGVLGRRGGGPLDFHWLVAQIGVFGPALAALIVSGTVREELRKNSVRNALLFLPVLALGIFVAAGRPSSWAKLEPLASILTVILAAVVVLFFSPWNRRLLNPGTGERYERP